MNAIGCTVAFVHCTLFKGSNVRTDRFFAYRS